MTHPPADRGLTLAPLLRRAGSVIESELRGSSMGGTLSDGTRIRIRCGNEESYPAGAVIAYVIPGGLIGHRIVAVTSRHGGQPLYFTRGDATIVCDGPVQAGMVLGEVTEWFGGGTWRPLPRALAMGLGRSLSAAVILAAIRITSGISAVAAGRISGALLRIAHRRGAAPGPP
jgi:hypothetical protein